MRVRQNPHDRKWYVLAQAGRFWMPISDGQKNAADARKLIPRLLAAEIAQRAELSSV